MLRSIESLYGCTVLASDGEIGSVEEAYVDDEAWGVRYLVVNTGDWLDKRRVLISPYSVASSDPGSDVVRVKLTRRQVMDSPDIDTDKPVSRQHETELSRYYAYPSYWMGPYLWEDNGYPTYESMAAAEITAQNDGTLNGQKEQSRPADVHLRSAREVKGYHLKARDGVIGHVEGFIFDDDAWAVRYLKIDTQNWWPGGKEVLIATKWIGIVDWSSSTVYVKLSKDLIKHSPEYDDSVPLSRTYEATLHQYYGKGGYWQAKDSDMEVFQKVGSREFSALLRPDASVTLKEGKKDLTTVTLNSGLPALAEQNNGAAILESTIADLLRALIREYARIV